MNFARATPDAIRLEGIRVLEARRATLLERSRTRRNFSPIEGSELEATDRAIRELELMSPEGVPAGAL